MRFRGGIAHAGGAFGSHRRHDWFRWHVAIAGFVEQDFAPCNEERVALKMVTRSYTTSADMACSGQEMGVNPPATDLRVTTRGRQMQLSLSVRNKRTCSKEIDARIFLHKSGSKVRLDATCFA